MIPIPDWGPATPDASLPATNEHLCVYNHDLSGDEKIERTIRFIVGRLRYLDQQLPANPRHQVRIDVRGQAIDAENRRLIPEMIRRLYEGPNSLDIQLIA